MKNILPPLLQVSSSGVDYADAIAQNLLTTNNVWMMLATALVFIMHLGFAGVEAGFGQAKNTVNILFKNTVTPLGLSNFHSDLCWNGLSNNW